MRSMHCSGCEHNDVPKTYARSSLAAEVTLWLCGIGVGLVSGAYRALVSPSHPVPTEEVQERMLATVSQSFAVADPAAATETVYNTDNIIFELTAWFSDVSFGFVRTFWWALLIPVVFSLWRQFSKYEGCRRCGSRHLAPIEIDPILS
jgi:hypothetical protein